MAAAKPRDQYKDPGLIREAALCWIWGVPVPPKYGRALWAAIQAADHREAQSIALHDSRRRAA